MSKIHANRGVPRNKKPLKNIVYTVQLMQYRSAMGQDYEKYKFKDLGYLVLYYNYGNEALLKNCVGFVTPDELKELLGQKQYAKFCEGKREFIIQRRIDGKNIPKSITE